MYLRLDRCISNVHTDYGTMFSEWNNVHHTNYLPPIIQDLRASYQVSQLSELRRVSRIRPATRNTVALQQRRKVRVGAGGEVVRDVVVHIVNRNGGCSR